MCWYNFETLFNSGTDNVYFSQRDISRTSTEIVFELQDSLINISTSVEDAELIVQKLSESIQKYKNRRILR